RVAAVVVDNRLADPAAHPEDCARLAKRPLLELAPALVGVDPERRPGAVEAARLRVRVVGVDDVRPRLRPGREEGLQLDDEVVLAVAAGKLLLGRVGPEPERERREPGASTPGVAVRVERARLRRPVAGSANRRSHEAGEREEALELDEKPGR